MGQTQTYDPENINSITAFIDKLSEFDGSKITDDLLILNIRKTITALKEIKETEYENEKTIELLRLMGFLTFFCESNALYFEIKNQGLHALFLKFIAYQLNKTKFTVIILRRIFNSLVSLSNNSFLMAIENVENGFHQKAVEVLDRINVINCIESHDFQVLELYDSIITFMHYNSCFTELRDALKNINIIQCFSNHLDGINTKLKEFKELKYIKLTLVSTIGNLMDDKQLDTLPLSQDFLDVIVETLNEIILKIITNEKTFDNTRYYITYQILNVKTVVNATNILKKLLSIAVNDTIKQKLFELGIIPILQELIKNGNNIEVEKSTELLCSLCFNENATKYIKENTGILKFIKNAETNTSNDNTKQSCQQILLMTNSSFGNKKTLGQNKQHIMISYNHKYQERCLKIYAELTKRGYHTWMDIHTVFTDLNDAMAEAIENASIVIICYSYEYKISNNCRLEAQYANKLNKGIIAVRVQNSYKPDGWLGMLLASKLYIDLSGDTNSSLAYKSLFSQIENLLVKNNTVGKSPLNQTSNQVTTTQQVEVNALQWTTDEVADWLKNNKLENLIPAFKTYTGIAIKALAEMKEKNYDKFCDTIDKEIEGANLSVATSEKLTFYQLIQDLFRH